MNDELYEKIIKIYLETESVKETADKAGVSTVKVRKVLITEGLWSSRTSEEINKYLLERRSTSEIAKIMCTTEKAVQQYLPYSRGIYMGNNRSVAALNSEEYRKRIEAIKEKILKKKTDRGEDNYRPLEVEYMDNRMDFPFYYNLNMDNELNRFADDAIHFEQYPGIVTLRELSKDKKQEILKSSKMRGEDIYRLHLELVPDWIPEDRSGRYEERELEFRDILRKYGCVKYGNRISRDILIPGETKLFSLHYIIQALFGWQNSHLHRFYLPEKKMKKLCDDKLFRFVDLVGIIFRSPWMDEEEEFWADDYETGSYKNWLRKKYTGSPVSLCHGESYFMCRKDVKSNFNRSIDWMINYYRSIVENVESDENRFLRQDLLKHYSDVIGLFDKKGREVAIKALDTSDIRYLGDTHNGDLLERLSIQEVLCFGDRRILGDGADAENEGYNKLSDGDVLCDTFEKFMDEEMIEDIKYVKSGEDYPDNQPMTNTFTDTLYYEYDFGDGWNVKIQGSCGCEDLIESGRISQEELDEAILQVHKSYRPVVIAQDGLSVLDDAGGLNGFCEFLKGTFAEEPYDGPYEYGNRKENLVWAKSFGWTGKMKNNKTML